MIVALVVIAVALLIVLAAHTAMVLTKMVTLVQAADGLAAEVLNVQVEFERQHRAERERLVRAIIAKNSGELANLERVENAARKIEAQRPVFASEAEYQAWLTSDLNAMMGEGTAEQVLSAVPLTPEGI